MDKVIKIGEVEHKPYVDASSSMAELTWKSILLGIFFGLLFGATTTYLALKVGLTVSASIPVAVLAIALFKRFGGSTILENNIVQTVGSAGESIAAGVAFTLPALLFLSEGKDFFNYWQIFFLALAGGILGVLFMIPLRRTLIVKEHLNLPYPEGTACADILVAGEKGGTIARKVYEGIVVGVVYKVLMSIVGLWKDVPRYVFSKTSPLPNGSIMAEVTPELLGVGYIIGVRVAGYMVGGGILSALVLTPLISYFGEFIPVPVAPATKLISDMSATEIWSKYIRYIGAGAVTFAGITTMIRTLPTIVRSFSETIGSMGNRSGGFREIAKRTDRDLPWWVVLGGIFALLVAMITIPKIPLNGFSSFLVLAAGFIFVSVSSRIVGLIGTSSNPISGMTIATLMGTSLLFIARGWTDEMYQPIALCVGAIVAIAAANAGATSQDLKTGYLVGATPSKQQFGMIIGVVTSACAVGLTVMLLNNSIGFGEVTSAHPNPLPAPQAMLMSTIIKGLFDQNLPWTLVLSGMGIAAVMEICGASALAFAVGSYLPLSTTAPIFIGGLIKWAVSSQKEIRPEESELETGALYSSGLIAGGAITGIAVAVLLGTSIGTNPDGSHLSLMDKVNTGFAESPGSFGDLLAIACFGLLCLSLYYAAIRKTAVK
jgi:putative OPT family oligopeptide transporter